MFSIQSFFIRCHVPGRSCPLLAILVCLLASPALADTGWVLTTADFKSQPITLETLDESGVKGVSVPQSTPVTVPFADLLQLERTSVVGTSNERFAMVLFGGERILGQPVGYKDEHIIWRNGILGEFSVAMKSARGIVRVGQSADTLDATRNDDMVRLSNGDNTKGIVTAIGAERLKMEVNGAVVEIPLAGVDVLQFAQTGKPQAPGGRAFRIRLLDGSLLTSATLSIRDATAKFQLPDGVGRELPIGSVIAVEQLNGPVSWLSSRLPEKIVQTPFLPGPAKPTRMDAALGERPWSDGPKPIMFGNRMYARGIGVHAYSRLDYGLDGSYKAFRTQYCIAAGRNQYADVTVRIKLDGKIVHEIEHFRAGVLSPPVVVEIPQSARLLTLEVDYGANNDAQDRFNWIEPALLRYQPQLDPEGTAPAGHPTTRP